MKTCKLGMSLILQVIFILLILPSAVAQQIWPVQVTGAMIPPRSLDLDVYTSERTQDLFFNAVLNDPVQSSVQVTLDLSIEHNGQVIYKTDPNFFGPPLTLSQFQLEQLDGGDLQPYLTPQALTGANNTGMGSLEIPEGFNRICLQVYGMDRTVPISNKFCVQGSFQLNQPPQPTLPVCGDQMPFPETQNVIFNWSPMHIGSSNSPVPVEYQFELVELPMGTNNANDAFESALQLYQTTTMVPALLYTQAEPMLQPDRIYAWRVKAYSLLNPTSKLFQNEGYSEVCTFMYYTGDAPNTDINGEDNPAPTGCEVFNTDYGPVSGGDLESFPIVEEDIVKLGYFNMEVTQAIAGASGFSGEGLVTFPMFKSKIKVNFSGLRVNANMRVFDAENVEAAVAQQFYIDPSQLQPVNVPNLINDTYVNNLNSYFENGQGVTKLVSGFNPADPVAVELPIGLDKENENLISIIGIKFTPRNAYLNMVSWSSEEGGDVMRFAATAVQATPFGMKSGSHLVLLDGSNGGSIPITNAFEIAYFGNNSTIMNCDCQGYKDLNLTPSIQISSSLLVQQGNGKPVILDLKNNTNTPENYVGDVKNIPHFYMNTLPDFLFKPKKGKLDLSETEKLNLGNSLTNYTEPDNPTWRGLMMENVDLELPNEYDFTGNGNKLKLNSDQLFIDAEQVAFGSFTKENMLSLEDGKMGNWAYSVDKFGIEINQGQTNGATLEGKVQVPVFAELFDYSGTLQANNSGQIILGVPVPETELAMDLWKAKFTPAAGSFIDAKLIEVDGTRSFFPKGSFDGVFSMSLTSKEFGDNLKGNAGQTKTELRTVLDIDKFDFELEGLNLGGFVIDPFTLPENRYQLASVNPDGVTIKMDGKELALGETELIYQPATNQDPEKLGFRVAVLNGNNKAELIFWANGGNSGFVFDGIEVNTINIQCECTSMIMRPSEERWGMILDEIIESEYGHLFKDNAPTGSLASFGIDKKVEGWQTILKTVLREKLNANHCSGFPMLDDQTISFLGKRLEVTSDAGKWRGVSGIMNPDNLTFAALDSVPANQLPFDVSNQLDKLGIKKSNLPEDSKLLITGFETNDSDTSWTTGARMELTLLYEVYNTGSNSSYLRFAKANIPVGPSSVDFTNLYMHLQADGVNGENDEVIYKVGDGSADLKTGSYAYMNCTDGFKFFNVQGIYKAAFSQAAGNTTNKIIHRLSSPVNGHGANAAEFGFTINNSEGLAYFIAPLKKAYDETEDWNFSVSGAEQIIFRPGDNFEAFIDFDDEDSHSDQPAIANLNGGNVPAFVGIVFKDIIFEVEGMKRAADEALTFDITDVVFDAERGVQASFSKTDPVTREENALFGGWQYDLSSLAFTISNNSLSSDGVAVKGNILPPILDGAPPESSAVTFEKGWVEFEGTIDFDAAGDVYQPDATLQVASVEEKLFHSAFIPGLGLDLNTDSKIGMSYNSGNGEFEASLDFSGNAGIYLSQPLIEAKFANSPPSGMDGISFVYELFEFSGLKVNDGDAVSNCTGGGTYKGIKTIEFGAWGIATGDEGIDNAAAELEEGLQGFPLTIGTPRFNCSGTNEYRMTLPVNLNLMSDEEEGGDDGGSTSGLNAAGELGFILGLSETDGFDFKRFELGCLLVEGAFGPLEMKGGLNILKSDGANTKWGDGFKAYLDATIVSVNVQAVAQFGVTNHDQTTGVGENPNGNKYRYFFVDLEATSNNGIPIGSPPLVKLYGLGGGFRYNMNVDIGQSPAVQEPNATNAAADHGDNDNCAIDDGLMGAGVSLSGHDYFPDNGVYGGYVKVIAGAVSPQVFVGDLAVGVTIQKNDGKLAFEQISISGNGYFQASSVIDRADENVGEVYANISYTISNKTLSGSFGLKMEYPPTPPGAPVKLAFIEIPDPSMNQDYASGQLDFNFGNGEWGFKFGSWADPEGKIAVEPASKLQYNTALLSPPFLDAGMQFKFYAQAGHKVDNIPPIEAVVPDWDNGGNTAKRMPDALFKSGNGMVMGAKMEMEFEKEFGPFYARLNAGLGFDLSMIKYEGVDCGNGGIGLNNWYMQGQAYAYAAAKVDMKYKLPFKSGTINIVDLYAALVLQAKFPNPSYFKGQLQARYSVLGGLLKGRANVKVEFGEKCEALENASPIAGIKMVADVFPSDKAKDVSIFVSPKLTTNLAIGSALIFPNYDDDGNISDYDGYRAVVDYVKVKKSGTSNYVSASIATETYGLTLKFNELLEANTEYELEYHIVWEEDKDDNGSFFPFKDSDGKPIEELDKVIFTTGAFPDAIAKGMLANQAPGFSQRYWHKNYASPLLRFNTGDPKLANLFPESTTISGKEVRYEYVAAITEFNESNGQMANKYTIPVVSYPGSKTFKKAMPGEISVGTVYKIPTVTMKDVTVREVRYPGLNDLNLGKGRMCKLEIIRRPEQTAFATTLEEVTGENGETITNRKIDGAQETEIAEATKILYEYHFGVSKYDNLHDKLQAATLKHQKSVTKRDDMNHPKQAVLTVYSVKDGSREGNTKDDYFTFKANEGFDKFDLKRIRKNTKISYLDGYGPEMFVRARYGGKSIASELSTFINSRAGEHTFDQSGYMNNEQKKYLTAVMQRYDFVNRESDGTYWHYNFYTNPADNNKWDSLSVTEINNKRLVPTNTLSNRRDGSYTSDVFSQNVQFGLIYQDLRTRILLNQMRWMEHIGYWEGEHWKVHTPGAYGNWHRYNNVHADILPSNSWMTKPNQNHNYIASEDGYQYTYHGRIKMEFPKVNKWKEMDTEVNLAQYPKLEFTLQPDRSGSAPVAENQLYRIKFRHNGKYLDVTGDSHNNGAEMQQYSTGAKVKLNHVGNDQYMIIIDYNGKAVEVGGFNNGNWARIKQWDNQGHSHQRWYIQDAGGGYSKLINVGSGKALGFRNNENGNNKKLYQYDYTNGVYGQQVTFEPVGTVYDPVGGLTTNNSTSGGELRLKTDATGVRALVNMKFEDIPKYIYLFRTDNNNHPIAMWSKVNNVLILFNRNNKEDVRVIPGKEFPEIVNGRANFYDTWKVNESGFRQFDLYGFTKNEPFRVVMMNDDGKYYYSQNNQYSHYEIFRPVADNQMQSVLYNALEAHFAKHSLPYNGIYQNIPGVIEPANYDWGGPGVAYKDNDEKNGGTNPGHWNNGYRASEGVDITKNGSSGSDNLLGMFQSDEWTKYSVNIKKSGRYNLIIKYAHGYSNDANIQLKLNGQNLIDPISLPGTGWQTPSSISIPIDINSNQVGIQKLSLHSIGKEKIIWKLQFIHQPPGPFAGTPIRVPSSRIEAENFDVGGEGVAYHEVNNRIGGFYRTGETVGLSENSNASNGWRMAYTGNDEWTIYTIDVAEEKFYDLFVGYGLGTSFSAKIQLYIDGEALGGQINLPTTGNWNTYKEHSAGRFKLPAGTHTLKVKLINDVALDYLEFKNAASNPYANVTVPGIIQAKNYDNGGEGVAYHKFSWDDLNRQHDAVYFYGPTWARYTFEVTEAKPMALFVNHKLYDEDFSASFDIDGNTIATIPMKGNGDKISYVGEVVLSPGKHVLTISGVGEDVWSRIRNVEFKAINPTPYNNIRPSVPCRVDFEEYAQGGKGMGWFNQVLEEPAKVYSNTGIELINGTTWFNYPINVPTSGEYQMKITYGSQKDVFADFSVDGNIIVNDLKLPDQNTYGMGRSITTTISLEAGDQILKALFRNATGSIYIDYFEITPIGNTQGIALKVDGANDYIKMNQLNGQLSKEITVESWINVASSHSYESFVHEAEWNGATVSGYCFYTSNGKVEFFLATGSDVKNVVSTPIEMNTWIHAAATYDGNNVKLYINGELKATKNTSGNIDFSPLPVDAYIGRYKDINEDFYFDGALDEVKIWSRALSAEEIQNNMNCKRLINSPNLLAYYNFDDKSLKNLVNNANATAGGFGLSDIENWAGSFANLSETCTAVAPEMALFEGGGSFSLTDDIIRFDLGDVPFDGDNIVKTIEIENKGNIPLSIYNFRKQSYTGGFSISELSDTDIAPGEKAFFTVTYNRKIGTHGAAVTFITNDPNQIPVNMTFNAKTVFDGANRSITLDGENDHISIPNTVTSAVGGGNAVTIEYWFKGTNSQSAVRLQNGNGYIVAGWRTADKGNRFIISSDGGTNNGLIMPNTLYDGSWHHVAMTWERNTTNGFRLYLDGKVVAQRNSANASLPNVNSGGYIGCYNGRSERTKGSIDEVRLWNRALSADEIKAWRYCKPASNTSGLMAYYNFDYKTLVNTKNNQNATPSGFALTDDGVFKGSFGQLSNNCEPLVAELKVTNGGNGISAGNGTVYFGDLDQAVGDQLTKSFVIKNSGTKTLNISDIIFSGGANQFTATQPEITTIPPGEMTSFKVTFQPDTEGEHSAIVKVLSDDPNYGGGYNFTVKGNFIPLPELSACSSAISAFPYENSFNNNLGDWIQDDGDDFNWRFDPNRTPSRNTGPSSPSHGSHYMFVEASSPNYSYKVGRVISPCIDLSGLSGAWLTFDYHMYGYRMGRLTLEVSKDGQQTWKSLFSTAGDKGNSWKTASIDLSAYANEIVSFRIVGKTSYGWASDMAVDNFKILQQSPSLPNLCTTDVSSYPYVQSFDGNTNGWTQETNDNFNWSLNRYGTPSYSTGPSKPAHGSHYLFTESSSPNYSYKTAIISSPCFKLTGVSSPKLTFNYHMYGGSMGTLELQISTNNKNSWHTIKQFSGNKGNSWKAATIDLSSYTGKKVAFRFVGKTANSYTSDMAIDNFRIGN